MTFRRMLPFLLLNVVISASVVLGILYWWEGREPEPLAGEPVVFVPTSTPDAVSSFIEETPIPLATEEEADTRVHIVQAGDTLGAISTAYDVLLDDIMTVNGITDPNSLQVGQELIIPINGIPTETPEPTPTDAPNIPPTPIPTEPFEQGEAIIEIREVVGAGVLTEEAVSIVNTGSRPLALVDWQLRDEDGNVYTFEQNTLFGDGAGIIVHTEAGLDTDLELYWGLEEPIWEEGETVTLLDGEGTEQASFTLAGEETEE